MKYEIVRYRPEFHADVISLQSALWSKDLTLNSAYFTWKYEQNPYLRVPLLYLALCRGRVVGARGLLGTNFVVGRSACPLHALGAGDLVIAAEHRNCGLFGLIMRHALAEAQTLGFRIVMNLSGSAVTQLASQASGWRSAGVLKRVQCRCVLRAERAERDWARNFDAHLGGHRPRGAAGRVVASRNPCVDKMAKLNQSHAGTARIRQVRDERYFAWRFANPLRIYRYLFHVDETLQGYLVLSSSLANGNRGGQVLDWDGAIAAVDVLLRTVLSWELVSKLETWSHIKSRESLLTQLGFKEAGDSGAAARHRPQLLVAAVDQRLVQNGWRVKGVHLLDPQQWDLHMADSDSY